MRKLRTYIDTSVISHLFHLDAVQRMEETREFFENTIAARVHDPFVSPVVIDELRRTSDEGLRRRLLGVIGQYSISVLPADDEVVRLAGVYLSAHVVPAKYPEDALHVAFATLYEMDVLVTWNFRHLARARTVGLIAATNLAEGYTKPLQILTPLEVLAP